MYTYTHTTKKRFLRKQALSCIHFSKHFGPQDNSPLTSREASFVPACRVREQSDANLRGGQGPRRHTAGNSRRPTIPTAAPEAGPDSPLGPPLLPFRRKKDMAGPGSGRRARGDCRGEGPAPLIQQPARTSGAAEAAALVRKETLLPGVGPTASSGCPGRSCRHIINKPPAQSSGPSPREASREAAPPAPPLPLPASSCGCGGTRWCPRGLRDPACARPAPLARDPDALSSRRSGASALW